MALRKFKPRERPSSSKPGPASSDREALMERVVLVKTEGGSDGRTSRGAETLDALLFTMGAYTSCGGDVPSGALTHTGAKPAGMVT